MFSLEGKTMIITGGAGNNGLAIIRMALEAGMNVAFMSGWHQKAQDAIAKLDPKFKDHVVGYAQNPQGKFGPKNIEDAPELYDENTTQEDVLRWIYDRFGSIDVVVNGSGGHVRKNFDETDYEFWEHSMEILRASFFNVKLAMPYLMKSKSPRVINLTTCDGRAGGYCFNPSFAAARGGMIALTHELAKELGPRGITVNAVMIGHIEGDVPADDTLPDWERKSLLERTPLGRLGVPEDVAGAVCFLASDEASFINGATIDVNGGLITC